MKTNETPQILSTMISLNTQNNNFQFYVFTNTSIKVLHTIPSPTFTPQALFLKSVFYKNNLQSSLYKIKTVHFSTHSKQVLVAGLQVLQVIPLSPKTSTYQYENYASSWI